MNPRSPYRPDEDLPLGTPRTCEVPAGVEARLRNRFTEFRGRVVARPPSGWREMWAPTAHPLRWVTGFVGAAAAAMLLMAWLGGRSDAWGQVVKKMESLPWIHAKAEILGKPAEGWVSVPHGIWALRFGEGEYISFGSRDSKISESYRSADRRLNRLPMTARDEENLRQIDTLFDREFRGAKDADLSTPTRRLVKQQTREVEVDGKRWLDFELTFHSVESNHDRVEVFRVDPETRLPKSCVGRMQDSNEAELRIEFDYPESGPADVFALGVPRDADVVDYVPGPELAKILAGLDSGREKMEAYSGLIVQSSTANHWSEAMVVWRVWRSGNRWRIEQSGADVPGQARRAMLGKDAPPQPADDVDRQEWWKKAAETIKFHPILVSDGKTSYRFNVKAVPEQIASKEDWEKLRYDVVSVRPDDIPIPTATGGPTAILLPEFVARPPLGIPAEGRQATLDPTPMKGPKGTVLLTVRDKNATPSLRQRVWIDPEHGYMAMRQELVSGMNGQGNPQSQVSVIAEAAQSPGGVWYPLVMRSFGSSDEIDEGMEKLSTGITHYYLDFKTPIAPDIFATPTLTPADRRPEATPKPLSSAQSAQRSWSMRQLAVIGAAMNSYQEEQHHFPAPTLMGPDGKTPHSWRVALLPYLEQKELFDRYRLAEPWDSPNNLQVLEQMPDVYRAAEKSTSTNSAYYLLTGEGTLFPADRTLGMRNIVDSAASTLLAVEARRGIPWTKPEDIVYAADKPLPELGGFDAAGFGVVFVDTSARFIDRSKVDETTIRAWITPAGKESVKRPD